MGDGIGVVSQNDRAWTIDEMRKSAGSWSLASDSGMLQHLQEFSQKLLSQTHEIQDQVDRLVHETKLTNVRLSNVFNDFTMLANTQFMENRVYDEEVVQPDPKESAVKIDDKEKSKEQRETELIPRIMEAITLGLNVFDSAYETLDMNIANSDSEDDEAVSKADIILEPKDPYLNRPLPCLIGSEDFHRLDDLGLKNNLIEEKEDSGSESEAEIKSKKTDPSQPSNVKIAESKPRPTANNDDSDSESSDSGDLFGSSIRPSTTANQNHSSSSSDDDENEHQDLQANKGATSAKTLAAPDFSSELAAKLGASSSATSQPKPSSVKQSAEQPIKSKGSQPAKHRVEDDLFGPADDDDDDLFGQSSGLFSSKTKGLFDEKTNTSEGGLFESPPAAQTKTKAEPPPMAHKARKSENEDSATSTRPLIPAAESVKTKPVKEKGLFDEDEDDDDLFAAIIKKPTITSKNMTSDTVDGSSKDSSDSSRPSSGKSSDRQEVKLAANQTKPKLPAGAVSIFGGGDDQFKAAVVGRRDSGENALTAKQALDGNKQQKSSTFAAKPIESSSVTSGERLLSDDDDLFATPPAKTTLSSQPAVPAALPTSNKTSKGMVSLFDENDDDDNDLFAPATSAAKKAAPLVKTPARADPVLPVSQSTKPSTSKLLLVAEDDGDDDDDLFSVMTKPVVKKSVIEKPSSVVAETVNVPEPAVPDATSKIKPTKEAPKMAATKPLKKPLSLFDDDDEDGDLFSPVSKKSEQIKPVARSADIAPADSKKKTTMTASQPSGGPSLFADDDLLFSGSDEAPHVDLFGSLSPQSSPAKQLASKTKINAPEAVQDPVIPKDGSSSTRKESLSGDRNKAEYLTVSDTNKVAPVSDIKKVAPVLFGAEADDDADDLFSEPIKPAKKKPSGAVSMFGSQQDMLKEAFRKKGILSQDDKTSDDADADRKEAKTDADQRSESVTGVLPPKAGPAVATKAPKNTTAVVKDSLFDNTDGGASLFSTETTGRSSQSQGDGLNVKRVEDISTRPAVADINFAIPVQSTPILTNIAKDRAKVQAKRRPPSRRAVQSLADQDDPEVSFVSDHNQSVSNGALVSSTVANRNRSLISNQQPDTSSISEKHVNIVSELPTDDDDLFSTKPTTVARVSQPKSILNEFLSSVPIPSTDNNKGTHNRTKFDNSDDLFDSKPPVSASSDDFDHDIFSAKKPAVGTLSKKTEIKVSDLEDDDIFSRPSKKPAANTTVIENRFIPPDDDDIFAIPTIATAVGKDDTKKIDNDNIKEFMIPEEDDIFAIPAPKKVVVPISTPVAVISKSVPAPDDEDIFADSSLLKKAPAKPSSVIKVEDDDDNIFAIKPSAAVAPASSRSQPVKDTQNGSMSATSRKKALTKDENLFADDTDIFADLVLPKTKDKRSTTTKTAKTKAMEKQVVAGDADDDIFADASSSKVKSSTKTKSQLTKVTHFKQKDDETVDIFEDPLNVLQK